MNESYNLVTDASADLIPEFVNKENISIIPMTYVLGENEYICSGTESVEILKAYYNGERQGKMTRTSQISPQGYIDFFRRFAEKGESLLYLSLSGGLSSTYNSSQIAAKKIMEEFPSVKICCVDSRSTTAGIELLLECAAKNRESGMSIEKNAEWLENNRLNLCHWFMVEDLMHLKRNGRISPATALVGSVLGMKPILRIENDGTLINFAKKRGQKSALDQLVEFYNTASAKENGERVYIVHADNEEGADYLEHSVKKINPSCILTKSILSPVIGCHTGPDMCAIVHFGKRI